MRLYPSKGLCLAMAELQHRQDNERLMWEWLFCWAFYEMFIEVWTDET